MQTILENRDGSRVPVRNWMQWLALEQQVKEGKAYYVIRQEKLDIIRVK